MSCILQGKTTYIMRSKSLLTARSQHNIVPEPQLVSSITHVELAFMTSKIFNQDHPSSWPLFTTVETARSQFAPGTAIMVAVGGWGDTGFSEAARSDASRKRFARNIKTMIDHTGADGQYANLTSRFTATYWHRYRRGLGVSWVRTTPFSRVIVPPSMLILMVL